jgi:hypothetical protein
MLKVTRSSLAAGVLLALTLGLTSGCNESSNSAQAATGQGTSAHRDATRSLASGTTLHVTLGSTITSETAAVGDAWHGTIASSVETSNGGMIVAGSDVDGVVTQALGAKRGSRAMLALEVRSISVNGRSEGVTATAEPVIAGSTRARNLGAIAGSAVAGALIGKVVGDGKNAAVGGLIGGAAATGVVAESKGYQVELKSGTEMNFTVQQTVAMR